MKHLSRYFQKHPVIAGVRDEESLNKALQSNVIALFILFGDILILPQIMQRAQENDKLVFLHIDLIEGIGRDKKGIQYLAHNNLCDGVVTTKSNLIYTAKKEGLMAIQRLFLLDTAALKTGKELLAKNEPDAVEILPGLAAPYFVEEVGGKLDCPIIAGGLIKKRQDVHNLLSKNILAVSSSNSELWFE